MLAKSNSDVIVRVQVCHKPRLLSDNGQCYLSKELKIYIEDRGMKHTRGARYHPQTQGKIERFVTYYNNHCYHEARDNLTPADVYFGNKREQLSVRNMIKKETMKLRRVYNLGKGGLKKQLQLLKITP
ncbi:hypothetical protein ACFL6P_02005 [Candidatus Latescibacterota bacterium]